MALKTMDTLNKRAKEMVRHVKGHHVIAEIYLTKQSEKNKSTTLKLPSNTRWGDVVIMFDSLLEGKESYHSLPIWTAPSRGSPVASTLLQIPTASAASDCNWSLFGNTHTKARNRLTNTRVEKLVSIRANLRLFEPDNRPSSTRLESDSEYEASESDV